jgi:hypothetical protein
MMSPWRQRARGMAGLRQALENIAAHPPDEDPDVELRVKTALEIAAWVTFIDGDPDLKPLMPKTHELQEALFEVQRGRHVSWLEPKKKSGWAPRSVSVAQLRGRYAAIMNWLMDPGGWTETQAGNFVARHGAVERLMSQARSRKAKDIEIVRDWRQQAIANSDRELRAGFDHQRSKMGLEGVSITDEAKVWLAALNIVPA